MPAGCRLRRWAAEGGLVDEHARGASAICRQTLRLLLGRRHPRPGPARGRRAVPARDHRRDAGGQEELSASSTGARERAIVERTAARAQATRTCDRRPNSRRRRRARLLAGAPEVWPKTREQRCWVHKTANVLNKLPKSLQPKPSGRSGDLDGRDQEGCEAAFDAFANLRRKYDKAVECLTKDRDALLAFYDFPAEHWKHLRTTNRSRAPSQPSNRWHRSVS